MKACHIPKKTSWRAVTIAALKRESMLELCELCVKAKKHIIANEPGCYHCNIRHIANIVGCFNYCIVFAEGLIHSKRKLLLIKLLETTSAEKFTPSYIKRVGISKQIKEEILKCLAK